MKLLRVRWRDSYFEFDQGGVQDSGHDYIVTSVGYEVGRTDLFLSMAAELLPEGGLRAVTHIPLVLIQPDGELVLDEPDDE